MTSSAAHPSIGKRSRLLFGFHTDQTLDDCAIEGACCAEIDVEMPETEATIRDLGARLSLPRFMLLADYRFEGAISVVKPTATSLVFNGSRKLVNGCLDLMAARRRCS